MRWGAEEVLDRRHFRGRGRSRINWLSLFLCHRIQNPNEYREKGRYLTRGNDN